MTNSFEKKIRLSNPVQKVIRKGKKVEIIFGLGESLKETFDKVIFANHSNQALELLDNPSKVEQEILKNKISFLIAPEGTRSRDGKLGEFKKGAFHIAKNTGISIIPIIINGAYEAKNKSDWRLSPGKINIHFSDVISFDLYEDMSINELRDYVRAKIKDFVD